MTIVLSTPPYCQFYDDNGNPLSLGLVYTYLAGTLTPRPTYTDQGGLTQNSNPVVLDSAGRASIWLDNSASYKFIVKTSTGSTLSNGTVDNVAPFSTASGLSVLGTIAANTLIGNNTGSAATPTALTVSQVLAMFGSDLTTGFKNSLINGAFQIWQAGTTSALTTSVAYNTADNWAAIMQSSAAGTVSQSTDVPTGLGFQYSLKIGRTAASALTSLIVAGQALETSNSISLAGRSVVLSFYAKAGANFSSASGNLNYLLRTGTGTDESFNNGFQGAWTGSGAPINTSVTLTTSWQRFQTTVTLASTVKQLMVDFRYNPIGTAGADDSFYITGVMLEPGVTASAYNFRGFGQELDICRRHVRKTFNYSVTPAQNTGLNTGEMRFMAGKAGSTAEFGRIEFNPPMMSVASITTYNPAATNAEVRDITASADCSSTAAGNITQSGATITANGNASTAVGNILGIHFIAKSTL